MLKLQNLTKKFGSFVAVDNLNIEINKGDLYGFLGPNGAGKTTTIKMIVSLYSPTSGSIFINELNAVEQQLETKKVFSYVPDQPFVYDKLTGKEFLFFCGGLYNFSKSYIKNKVDELVELLNIGDWLNKRTEVYSQGMRQRLIIASAFINDPKLIIIDEPMVGLDPQSTYIVKQVLKQKVQEKTTVFMSTHSLHIVEEICNRVGIINKSKLIFDGSIGTLHKMKEEKNNNFEELFIELTNE
jgi:ABC-2 type transport system ATP-binding protein